MTKVALKGPVNGTGTYTLRAPETANTLELELPTVGTHLAGAQADGMPLGPGGDPVVESGSNSDGEWTRWADGTQVCRREGAGTLISAGTQGSLGTWTYPASFTARPALFATVASNADTSGSAALTGIGYRNFDMEANSTSDARLYIRNDSPGDASYVDVRSAHGRWK